MLIIPMLVLDFFLYWHKTYLSMKRILTLLFICLIIGFTRGQTKVPMVKKSGVYEVGCVVNGKNANFIFDSGASDVQLSVEFFNEGLKAGLFRMSDLFIEIVEYKVASGAVVKGRNVNIRQLKIGDLVLFNVMGSIIDSPNTPMLLGQSVLERFGTYAVDYDKLTLIIQGNSASKIEIEAKTKSKTPGQESIGSNLEKAISIKTNLEFEVIEINNEGPDRGLDFTIDVTNNSKFDYDWTKGSPIIYIVEVTTEDGKRYTSADVPFYVTLLAGRTTGSQGRVNVRGKKPVSMQIYLK